MQYTCSPLGSRRGVVVVVTVVMLTVIIGFAALAIDGGLMFLAKTELQRTADAAALAAAAKIDFRGDRTVVNQNVIAEAMHYASLNSVLGQTLTLNALTDVQIGSYSPETGLFQVNAETINAVQVTARRTTGSPGGAVPLFLMGLMGHETANVEARSIVMLRINCYTRGIRARDVRIAANAVLDNMCLYGRNRMHLSSGAVALNTTYVGSLDAADVTFGGGLPENFVVKQADMQPEAALIVAETIDGIEDGSLLGEGVLTEVIGDAALDSGASADDTVYLYYDDATQSEVETTSDNLTDAQLSDPDLTIIIVDGKRFNLSHAQPNTAYIFNQSVIFKGNATVENTTFAVRGNVKFDKNATLRNGAVADGLGAKALGLLATGSIHIGSGVTVEGAVIIAGGNLFLSNNVSFFEGMVEAAGVVRAASNLRGLNEGYEMPYGSIDATPVMVP